MTTQKVVDESLRQSEIENIEAHRVQIAAICRRYGVQRLALFGSVTREHDFSADSDLDFLVQFSPDVRHGFAYFAMEEELETLLGHKIELLTPQWLSEFFRDEVLAHAQTIYVSN